MLFTKLRYESKLTYMSKLTYIRYETIFQAKCRDRSGWRHMKRFFTVKTPEDIHGLLSKFIPLGVESVDIKEYLHRIAAEDMLSPIDLPNFNRSTMDGYAVRARDTFGASDSLPAVLEVIGEVDMGIPATLHIADGKAAKIPTGGMLPPRADAVVMIEYTRELDTSTIEVFKALAPLENVIQRGDDIKEREILILSGHKMRYQDVGILAAIGQRHITVFRRPRVAIISTGDEIVDIHTEPPPGKIRDINSYTLGAMVKEAGGEPIYLGIARDTFQDLKQKSESGLKKANMLIISGGSSVGVRDLTLDVINSFPDAQLLVHGISVSPGKPTILAKIGDRALWGLPGHVTSAMIVFLCFVKTLIQRISGEKDHLIKEMRMVRAKLGRNLPSAQGREDYVRIRLEKGEDGKWYAHPIMGKSGLISTMVKAHGILKIDMYAEGLGKGEMVDVMLF